MSTINIKCVDQVLTFQNMPVMSSGDQNVDTIQFDFCSQWDGYVKVAVFFQQKGECSYALVNGDGSCQIPNSIMRLEGRIFIAVTGTHTENKVRTSNVIAYNVAEGVVDASLQDEFPAELSEEEKNDVYNKMLELTTGNQAIVDNFLKNTVYVQMKDANEFEYDEGMMETKIKELCYSKEIIDEKLSALQSEIDSLSAGGGGGDYQSEIDALKTDIASLGNDIATLRTDMGNAIETSRINIMTEVNNLIKSVRTDMTNADNEIKVMITNYHS